jgi:cytochrome c oxidase assembly protein subunit 15
MEYRIMLEYFHRLAAAGVGILLLVVIVRTLMSKDMRARIGGWVLASFLLLIVQITLGKLTVDHLLRWEVVAMHLGCAIIFLSAILGAYHRSKGVKPIQAPPRVLWSGRFLVVVFYFQILLGGSVSSHYAGLACPDFPTCHGEWWPEFVGLVGLQFSHRLGAIAVTLASVYFLWELAKAPAVSARLGKPFPWLLGGGLLLQWSLGAGMVFLGVANEMIIPQGLSVAHLAIGTLIFILIIRGNYEFGSR